MKTANLWLLVGALALSSSASAQETGSDPVILFGCDWADWYNSFDGMATQPSYDEIQASWECYDGKGQPVIDWIYRNLDFDATWLLGPNSGYTDPCNTIPPVGRTLNAVVLMGYSGRLDPHCNTKDGDILDWGLCWSASRYEELSGFCAGNGDDAFATTTTDPFGISDGTTIWATGIYAQGVDRLSSTIIHEARHYDCGHNGGDGCPRKASCDERWGDGCPWPRNGAGANRYQINWMQWYANRGIRGTSTLKLDAIARANVVLMRGFNKTPCFTLADDGVPSDVQIPGCSN